MAHEGCKGSTKPTPVTPLERLQLCRTQIVWLFYDVVPNARATGHPGTPGPAGGKTVQTNTQAEMILDEILATLQQIRPHLNKS